MIVCVSCWILYFRCGVLRFDGCLVLFGLLDCFNSVGMV